MSPLGDPDRALAYARQVAAHRGWVVNPDEGFTKDIAGGLAAQARRFGKPFCPCRDVDGGEADRDIVCPCAYAEADILAHGQCFCGLYLAANRAPGPVGSIPERRP